MLLKKCGYEVIWSGVTPCYEKPKSLTEYFTIYPGDLLYTGTPVGVGPTHKGDVFEGYFEANQVFSVKVNP